jgi:hypothetical protein
MARLARAEVFDPNEVTVAHVFNRTVRRCFLMAMTLSVSDKNFDHRKVWIEEYPTNLPLLLGSTCWALRSYPITFI